MKKTLRIVAVLLLIFIACKTDKKPIMVEGYQLFGDKISTQETISAKEMLEKYSTLQIGDTVKVKFTSTIKEVCASKGCWMRLLLDENTETMVRFKDYGFFMPLDSKGKEVIVNGIAFVKETSVEELRHYAEDAGKSEEEIAKITASKKELSFEADGVLLR